MKRHRLAVLNALVMCLLLGVAPCFAADDEGPITFSSDLTRWYPGEKVEGAGNVVVTFKDASITADSATADLQTNLVVFNGSVKVVLQGTTVGGEDLTFNMKTKDWTLQQAASRIEPKSLKNQISAPLFVHGDEITGTDSDVKIKSASLTSCDLEHPHYSIRARLLEIYPDSKIIARDVSIMGVKRKLFSMKTLVVPIRTFSENIIPQIGSSSEEGLFLKLAYAYSATRDTQGYLKLDLMQLKGIGLGVNQSYKTTKSQGTASVYYLPDRQLGATTFTGSLRHRQQLGSMTLNLTSNYRANDYMYYPSTTAQSWQIGLAQNTPKVNMTLNVTDSLVRGTSTYETLTGSLRYTDKLTSTLTGMLSVDARSYDTSSMASADEELNSTVQLRQRGKTADVTLTASKRIDLDGSRYTGDNSYSSLDRLPELSIETDTYRLGKEILGLPFRLAFTAGEYHETPSDITNPRLLLEMDMMGKTIDIGSRTDLEIDAGLRQAYYAADMQQYVLKYGGRLTTRYSDCLTSRLSYDFSRPQGYSPFVFDATTKENYSRFSIDYQKQQKLKWSIVTGYDFDEEDLPWRDVALRVTAWPSARYAFSLSTGYDLNDSEWNSVIGQIKVNYPDRAVIDLGARYSMQLHRLDVAKTRVDLRLGKKWRLQGIASWNGSTDEFDYLSFLLIRDLHCMEASIQYDDEVGFRTNKGITLGLRIKALPYTDRFGIGQYGQAVDTSVGDYFY